MAPKKPRYLHNASGRHFTYSDDGLYMVFEDTGQMVAVPRPQVPPIAGSSANAAQIDTLHKSMAEASITGDRNVGAEGVRWTGEDSATGIQSNWEIGPPTMLAGSNTAILRPYKAKFVSSNGAAELKQDLTGGKGQSSRGPQGRGYTGYQRSKDPENDFVRFRVIQILFIPPPTSTLSTITGGTPKPDSNDGTTTRMHRFVIIEQGSRRSFKALPIKTYNGKGCGAAGVVKSHHTIIYTGDKPPKQMLSEAPGVLPNGQPESPMRQQPIRVKQYDKATALDSKSRLDFFDVYEFDYNHYFKFFGTIHETSRPVFIPLFNAVRAELQISTQQKAAVSSQTVASNAADGSRTSGASGESSQASIDPRVKRVVDLLAKMREYADGHGLTKPTITTAQLNYFAQNEDAFKQWAAGIKAAILKKAKENEENSTGDEEGDDDDGNG